MRSRKIRVALKPIAVCAAIAAASVLAVADPVESSFSPNGENYGLVDPSTGMWHLYENDYPSHWFYFGNPGDYPFMGDWDCDGIDTPGLYRQSDGYAYLRNSNTQGVADVSFFFGNPGDVPIAGDFNADGCDTVSIYRPSQQRFYIINDLGTNDGGLGAAEYSFIFGNPGDKPFVGDFDGNGQDTVGLHRESTGLVYYRNTNTTGNAHNQFIFGDPGDRFVAGDWTGDGVDSPGLFRPADTTMYMRFENSQGNADVGWETVGESSWLPVAGTFADCNRQTSIPAIECEALMALYFSSTGYKWEVYPGWLTEPDPCEWLGVECENGSVTRLIVLERENWGTIPPEIGNLTQLVELRLGYRLSGVIPPEIGNLTQLRGLYLNGNNLYGAIPPELGNLTELEWLVLDGNRLAGSIPIQLGQLTHLEQLSLTNNDLSGSIPSQLGNLTELTGLQLRMNQLSGEVPTTLQDLPYLRLLNLRDQKGCLTAEPDFAAWLSTFDVDWNNGCF